jgi:hypothetical protein
MLAGEMYIRLFSLLTFGVSKVTRGARMSAGLGSGREGAAAVTKIPYMLFDAERKQWTARPTLPVYRSAREYPVRVQLGVARSLAEAQRQSQILQGLMAELKVEFSGFERAELDSDQVESLRQLVREVAESRLRPNAASTPAQLKLTMVFKVRATLQKIGLPTKDQPPATHRGGRPVSRLMPNPASTSAQLKLTMGFKVRATLQKIGLPTKDQPPATHRGGRPVSRDLLEAARHKSYAKPMPGSSGLFARGKRLDHAKRQVMPAALPAWLATLVLALKNDEKLKGWLNTFEGCQLYQTLGELSEESFSKFLRELQADAAIDKDEGMEDVPRAAPVT